MKFTFIKDTYTQTRGGRSQFLHIYCSHCNAYILLYQKDGPGPLKRLYIDRIRAPKELAHLIEQSPLPPLTCQKCKRLIGVPLLYEPEQRKAYTLFAYTINKKRGRGVYDN